MSGGFIWYELMTDDVAAAAAFYARVVGWRAVDSGLPGPGYRYLNVAGENVGGLMQLPAEARSAGARPAWYPYLQVGDVAKSVAAICADGGTAFMPPTDIPGVGRFAMLADPQGAAFYVMAPAGEGASRSFDPRLGGHCGWNELRTPDPVAAEAFYVRHFGWGEAGEMPAAFVAADGVARAQWRCAFNVDDIDAAARRLRAAGGEALEGLRQVRSGAWLLPARDPQGALFGLIGASWGD